MIETSMISIVKLNHFSVKIKYNSEKKLKINKNKDEYMRQMEPCELKDNYKTFTG